MIVLNCKQGSDEWVQARLGIPTASQFHRIITPKTMKPAASAEGYIDQLVAEYLLGEQLDDSPTDFMQRGNILEEEAVRWYEFNHQCDTIPVGLILRDDRMVGCSPDRLVGENGGLEIKCPMPKNHVGYLLHGLSQDYRCQIQGGLWLSGRDWWDFVSYHPTLPKFEARIDRDDEFIRAMAELVDEFVVRLLEARKLVEEMAK